VLLKELADSGSCRAQICTLQRSLDFSELKYTPTDVFEARNWADCRPSMEAMFDWRRGMFTWEKSLAASEVHRHHRTCKCGTAPSALLFSAAGDQFEKQASYRELSGKGQLPPHCPSRRHTRRISAVR
jgi:hypothetical protein